ncbi:MAG: LysM peptidoglycan-binding domain-containing protein [Treponema sp.]|jgi:outer membrane biosynthesis protein TonB|nr:LysM peptidoglycan-binding domain-containing protein [Treponema sp.]
MAETIGIKIANGEFYPIIDGNVKSKKRLVLTTVHNKQRSVQIDLYKSVAKTMADAFYIGSLVIENIKPKPKGEPSIEMVVSSTDNGEITAEAIDLDTSAGGQHQYLNVSLKSLEEDTRDDELPDFELEQNDEPPTGLYERAETIKQKEEKKFPWIVVIIAGVLIIGLCLALWFFFIWSKGGSAGSSDEGPPAVSQSAPPPAPAPARSPAPPPAPGPPPAPARTPAPAPPAARQAPAQTPPVIAAPAQPKPPVTVNRTRPPAPVSSYKVPATIPRDGVAYRIRWGDTLWDIAAAFYRNPWLYPRIARYNGIRNPDLIISGRTIRIPPKN